MNAALLESSVPGLVPKRGKVRDLYDFGDRLLLVASDRISAFDWVLPTGIPDKGRILTQLSAFWFELLGEPNHLISTDPAQAPLPPGTDLAALAARSSFVKRTRVVPVECVVRGYLEGSGWREYQRSQTVCGLVLPSGLRQCDRLPAPIFTPATKEESGHDENISFERMCEIVGKETAEELRFRSLDVYRRGAEHAAKRGIIIADTKFEWGWDGDRLILIDEVLTPDSSRFWPADLYAPGRAQASFDKQFVREWLDASGWDKNSPPPALPLEVIEKTRAKYVEAYEHLSGRTFA